MRALVKYLDGIGDAEIVGLNIPNGIPLVYELDAALKPIRSYYLGDAERRRGAAAAAAGARPGLPARLTLESPSAAAMSARSSPASARRSTPALARGGRNVRRTPHAVAARRPPQALQQRRSRR